MEKQRAGSYKKAELVRRGDRRKHMKPSASSDLDTVLHCHLTPSDINLVKEEEL
jgi:hypothetical protein